MNAQEALDELKKTHVYEIKSHFGNHKFHIKQDEEAVNVIQQLIDQANASSTNPLGGYQQTSTIKSKTLSFDEFAIGLDDNEKALLAQDQANAKPKTLEELGWVQDVRFTVIAYSKENTYHNDCSILFIEERKEIETWGDLTLTHEEILAIAEKMKELGMTEKENK